MSLTKDDLKAIEGVVKRIVDGAIEESKLQTAAGFGEVHVKLDTLQQTTERTEDKADEVIIQQREHVERLDNHGERLIDHDKRLGVTGRKLKPKAA